MSLIPGYPKGSDITILNTIYVRPRKNDETGKWDRGSLTAIFRDNVTGEKHNVTIINPTYEFYVAKPEAHKDYNRLYIERENATKVECPYNDLLAKIAEITGNTEFYKQNLYIGNRAANDILHSHPDIFNSDMNIEDNFRFRFGKEYTNNIYDIEKSYFDIEADIRHMRGDFPELGECPVNAVSIIFEEQKEVYQFLLRDPGNPLVAEYEERVENGEIFPLIKQFVIDAVGGWKEATRFGIMDFKYNFVFYDQRDELQMLYDLFYMINERKPDFLLAWNMGFDVPYIIERIKILGGDPALILCSKDFKVPIARYYIDERNKNEFAERGDFATISSYTVFLDQMIHFASRRKGQSAFSSFSLDYIGETVAGVKKLDYKHITTDLAKLPEKNYLIFSFYNIMDTIVQKCIEHKTGDLEYVFGKCNLNNTRYQKCHRQTIYLVNRGCKEFLKSDDFIIGNNTNKGNIKTKKFQGAFIADPSKMDDFSKLKINGHPINILNNAIDLDYASLYPSILREFNMSPNTQIGMILIEQAIWDGENRRHDPEYSRSGEFLENLQSGSYLEFCTRWFKLGNFMQVYHDVIEYYRTIKNPAFGFSMFKPDGTIIPAQIMINTLPVVPATIYDADHPIVPGMICTTLDPNKVKEVITNAQNPKQRYGYIDRGSKVNEVRPLLVGNLVGLDSIPVRNDV